MTETAPSKALLELSRGFHDLSVAITNYRYDRYTELDHDARQELDSSAWTLLNTASDLSSIYISRRLENIETDLIEAATDALQKAKRNIDRVKNIIDIVAAAIALAGSLYTATGLADASAIVAAVSALSDAADND